MPSQVFVTGASGFVGSSVVSELLSRGHGVSALAHRGKLQFAGDKIRTTRGSLFEPAVLDEALRGCDSVIHLVGIIAERPAKGITFERIHFQGTCNVVEAAVRAGLKRYVQMSALGTRPDARSEYHRTKYRAEEYVRHSPLEWTIIRPSMIHGPAGEFMKMEAAWARGKAAPFLFMPYFRAGLLGRSGAGALQPVFVEDVARAFVDALEKPQTIGKTYDLGGAQRLTWPQLHQTVSEAIVGKRRWIVPLPVWYAKLLTRVVPASLLPFNRDQVIMSQENNTGDMTAFKRDFGWEPKGFAETFARYSKDFLPNQDIS